MNDSIKKVVDKLYDKEEFISKLSKATNRSESTITRYWLSGGFNIPKKFFKDALKLATRLYLNQEKEIRNIEVQFEEVRP